jgi:hypothetical protein
MRFVLALRALWLIVLGASVAACGFDPHPESGAVACKPEGAACCPEGYVCVGRGLSTVGGPAAGTCWSRGDLPPEALVGTHDYTPTILSDPACLVTDWLPSGPGTGGAGGTFDAGALDAGGGGGGYDGAPDAPQAWDIAPDGAVDGGSVAGRDAEPDVAPLADGRDLAVDVPSPPVDVAIDVAGADAATLDAEMDGGVPDGAGGSRWDAGPDDAPLVGDRDVAGDLPAQPVDAAIDVAGAEAAALDAEADGTNPDDAGAVDGAPSTLGIGLVSWWRGEGNASDSVGSNDGTPQGGIAFVEGRVGQAFEFNGTDATVTVPDSTSLLVQQGFSLAFWIRIYSVPLQQVVILRKLVLGLENKNVVLAPDGTVGFYLYDAMNETALFANAPLIVDTWHHIAVVYDGTTSKLYLDGALDASVPASGSIENSTGDLIFGQSIDFRYFAGALDEIRWYSRGLSDAEVSSLASGTSN